MDTSAIHGLVKIKKRALEVGTQLALAHVSEEIDRQLHEEEFLDGDAVIEPIFKDADSALEWCEDFLLRTAGYDPSPKTLPIEKQLKSIFRKESQVEHFQNFLKSAEFSKGDVLEGLSEEPYGLYFVEEGVISVYLAGSDQEKHRIRSAGPGSVIGIASFFKHRDAHALVTGVADTTGRAYVLTGEAFERMKTQDPDLAMAFQAHALQSVSDRLASNLRTLSLVLRLEE